MGTPLTPKYIPYTYMDPLGESPVVTANVEPQVNCVFSVARPRKMTFLISPKKIGVRV